ncbi:MAG TPA: ATPase [Methanobacterium sp.]
MNQEILNFLGMIGVNNQFISLYDGSIFINNLKFSRFSRRKEELFLAKHPDWKVVRSKIFQKMCVRASRILSKPLNPGEKVFIEKNSRRANLALYIILEPYTRRYGIEIICNDNLNLAQPDEVDLMASPLTLDQEVENIIHQMIQGEKIETTISKGKSKLKTIYPLINIPDSWIESWVNEYGFTCSSSSVDIVSSDLLEFLEEFIPDVRENMLKSALFVS